MTGDLNGDESTDGTDEDAGAERLTAVEQALLDATLDFYGAAQGVIDLSGEERPQVRQDAAAGFQAVRQAMGVLEDRVRSAHAAGVAPARIAQVARIEPEMVGLILQRDPTAAPTPSES